MPLKFDLRYIKAEEAIKEAFLDLLATMPSEKISVSLICEKARCSRSTFYDHYETRELLYESIIDEMLKSIASVDSLHSYDNEDMKDFSIQSSLEYFDAFMAHWSILERLLKERNGILQVRLTKMIADLFVHQDERNMNRGKRATLTQELAIRYAAAGMVETVITCIERPDIDIEEAKRAFIDIQQAVTNVVLTNIPR